MKGPSWSPRFIITPAIARGLMAIEATRAVVASTLVPPAVEEELRRRARVTSTHFSTRIEGNRLTLAEAEQAIAGRQADFRGRERDVEEVKNYWDALLRVEDWAAKGQALSENLIRRLHARLEEGARAKPTPFRDGQNVIRDSSSGGIVYLPPEAGDVPGLVAQLVSWVTIAEMEKLPIPLIAALVHYQFVTIHPFYDGNGRTARLLATFVLHRGGYGLQGLFSLEEQHFRDLGGYYRALVTHPHHNYYFGRAQADLTPWLEYFIGLMARVFQTVRDETLRIGEGDVLPPEPDAIRKLGRRARRVIALFATQERVKTADVTEVLGLSDRQVRDLLRGWVQDGWLEVADQARRSRAYRLSADYRRLLAGLSAAESGPHWRA